MVRLMTLRQALILEVKGMRRNGPSALSIVKKEFHLKGNRLTVLKKFEGIIAQMKRENI